jgi:hypothetical protein
MSSSNVYLKLKCIQAITNENTKEIALLSLLWSDPISVINFLDSPGDILSPFYASVSIKQVQESFHLRVVILIQ